MLTRFLTLIAALLCATAQAADLPAVYEGKFPNGATILLHEAAGPCVDGARQATWISADATERVPGCFEADLVEKVVKLAWLDGDSHMIPLNYFKKPSGGS